MNANTSTNARTTASTLGTILSIWAHPDDETYLAGGLMAAARDNEQRVVNVSATAGERGTSDPDAWPPARLGAVRRCEAAAAMAVLGVTEHRILGLPDGGLAELDEVGIDAVTRLLDEVEPDTIVTFGPEGETYHPDHIAVHRWVTAAWERRGRRGRLLYFAATREHLTRFRALYEELDIYMIDARPIGADVEDIALRIGLDGHELDRKVAALRALATQTSDAIHAVGAATYAAMLAEETFVDALSRATGSHGSTGSHRAGFAARGLPVL
jgi:LmbE family N-acetylglucosaminyl deacetylase